MKILIINVTLRIILGLYSFLSKAQNNLYRFNSIGTTVMVVKGTVNTIKTQ